MISKKMKSPNNENSFPMFLNKLWKLVEDEKTNDLIYWSQHNGNCTFTIRNQAKFAKEILPLYFKHGNMASFIRQLNMYGFRKIANVDAGGLKSDNDEVEFYHLHFARNRYDLLSLIKRKGNSSVKTQDDVKPTQNDTLDNIIGGVNELYKKQENMNTKLESMKKENENLWREVAVLRQQHMTQQKMLQKLLQFIVNMVRGNRSLSATKRKFPLMLDEIPHSSKTHRLSRAFSYDPSNLDHTNSSSAFGKSSSSGPVIHDVTDSFDTDMFLKGVQDADEPEIVEEAKTPLPVSLSDVVEATIGSPLNLEQKPVLDEVQDSVPDGTQLSLETDTDNKQILEELMKVLNNECPVISIPNSNYENISDKTTPDELKEHVGATQLELDNITGFLSTAGHTLDFSSVLNYFPPDNFLTNPGASNFDEQLSRNDIVGNELVEYNPAVLDFHSDDIFPEDLSSSMVDPLFENLENDIDDTAGDDIKKNKPNVT